MGRLDIRICAARNLPDTQMIGKPDPYVIVKLENQTHRTSVCNNQINPTWNEVFKFTVADPNSAQIRFELWNSNVVSDEFLGCYKLSLAGLYRGIVKDEWYILQQCKTNAELHIRMMAHDFGHQPPADMNRPSHTMEAPASAGFTPQQSAGYPAQQQNAYYQQQQPQQQQQYGYVNQQQQYGYTQQQQQYGNAGYGYPQQQAGYAAQPQYGQGYNNVYPGAPQQQAYYQGNTAGYATTTSYQQYPPQQQYSTTTTSYYYPPQQAPYNTSTPPQQPAYPAQTGYNQYGAYPPQQQYSSGYY